MYLYVYMYITYITLTNNYIYIYIYIHNLTLSLGSLELCQVEAPLALAYATKIYRPEQVQNIKQIIV